MKSIDELNENLIKEVLKGKKNYISLGNDELGRNKVMLLPDYNIILKLYGKKERWEREIASLKYMESKTLMTPIVKRYGISSDGKPWVMMTRLEGQTLENVLEEMNEIQNENLLYQLGEYQAYYHEICRLNYFGDWDINQRILNRGSSYREFTIDKNRKYAERTISKNHPDTELFKESYNKLIDFERYIDEPTSFSLCHNDFSERNILVKKNSKNTWEISGIVDFEMSYPNDPESDLARMLIYNYFKSSKSSYLNGYTSHRKVTKNFYEKNIYYLLALCLEVSSWAFKSAPDYYNLAKNVLTDLINKTL